MINTEEIVQKFVNVWNERDAARRKLVVQSLWTKDGRHLMGVQDVQGHDALEQRVAASNQNNVVEKGYEFRPATNVKSLPGVATFRWDMVRSTNQEVVSAGVGFLQIDDQGQIICDYLFTES
jgi:hypothetical protein